MNLAAPRRQTSQQVSVGTCDVVIKPNTLWSPDWALVLIFYSPAAAAAKFRRDSLFCPDELDSLFSYFDTGSGPRSKSTT